MVFYRKYRPQKIEELDSAEIREKLYGVLKDRDSAPHAYLFTGPKGLGKTSTARIVAKSLNCERLAGSTSHVVNNKGVSSKREQRNANSTVEPCNKCNQCVSITNGTNMDVLEIDGASNRGIDEIRDLREKVRLSPVGAYKKVYIIDEVHMLTTEAFNALLKTLEEPPSHVVFILCTTEPHKVPDTIVSRCFNLTFKKASNEELVRSLQRIAKKEKLSIDKDALHLIATLSDGSFRDGVKILEEIVFMAGGKKITKELVEEEYKISNIKYQLSEMLELLSSKNTKDSLKLVGELVDQGIDMKFFLEELISNLHLLLLSKAGVGQEGLKDSRLNIQEIKELVEMLSKAYGDLKYAVLPQLPLELVIVEWGEQSEDSPVSLPAPIQDSFRAESPHATTSFKNDIWHELITEVNKHNHSVAGVLRGCSLKSYDGESLIIEANFKFHKDKLSERKTLEVLEEACKEITKKNIKVEVLLKSG